MLKVFKLQQGEALSTHECAYVRVCAKIQSLVAATSSDHHVAVFLEDDVGAVIKVEH